MYILPNPYLTIPVSVRRYFGASEVVQRWPIYLVDAMGLLREAKEDKVRHNPVGARSMEGLDALGRLGLEGLLLFMYPNCIL